MVVMEKGKIVRSRVDEVRRTGRNTMGVQFATPDKGDSIVAVARNTDSGVEDGLEEVPEDDAEGAQGEEGADPAPDGAVPTVINSVSETTAKAGSLAAEQDADDNDADNNAGGSE